MAEPFPALRPAALTLLNTAPLSVKEAGFVGQMAFAEQISPKQARWFSILLERYGLPSLAEGVLG